MDITKDTFEKEVLQASNLVLLDFWAVWCGPCRIVSPILEEIAQEQSGKVSVLKVNVDEEPELSQKFNIMSIPTMKFFKNGQEVGEIIGAAAKNVIEAEIAKHI